MKIDIASTGNNLESAVSPIFGRSSAFLIVNLIKGTKTYQQLKTQQKMKHDQETLQHSL